MSRPFTSGVWCCHMPLYFFSAFKLLKGAEATDGRTMAERCAAAYCRGLKNGAATEQIYGCSLLTFQVCCSSWGRRAESTLEKLNEESFSERSVQTCWSVRLKTAFIYLSSCQTTFGDDAPIFFLQRYIE